MSDLGTKALLQADLDAKVTTNAPDKANTGLRVRTFLTNFIDTIYALIGRDIAPTATFSTTTNTAQDPGQDTVRFNNATIASVTQIALSDVVGGVDKGDLNSRFTGIIQFRPVGTTDTIEFQITSVVHTSWTQYTVTYLKGTLPANGTVMAVRFLPSNTVNVATTTALAAKQNRTRNVLILTAVSDTRNLDGTEDIIVATGVSPTAVFDPGTLPVGFILEIRNDASQPCAFNPDTGSLISIPAGGSAILRQKAAGTWVDLLALKENTGVAAALVAQEVIDRNAAITAAVVGLWDDRGNYDASVNTFPATGGSGSAGAILKGDIWLVSVAGTLGGAAVVAGDTVRAKQDTPGQTAGNWAIAEGNVQFPIAQSNVTNLVSDLAAKAPLASPALTGTPTAPTAAATTNTTQLATTAFVRQEISALGTVATYRTGAALQFDVPAQYNTRATPSNATVTLSLSGAVNGTEIICFFNHGAEPTWPAGITMGGNGWVNSGVNAVRFIYSSGGVVSGTIISSNTSYTNPEVVKKPTGGDQATTGTTAVAITGMSFTAAANTDYAIEIVLQITGTASGGVCIGLYSSVGTDQTFALSGQATNSTVGQVITFATTHSNALNTINTGNKAAVSASTNTYLYLRGKLRGGAASSVIDLRFASATSGQTATVFALGSFMKATTC